MKTIHIGREGFLNIGFESSVGVGGVTSPKTLPFTACTLHNVVEVLDDETAKGIRERAWGSITARTRGEGDITILADVDNAPYLFISALGYSVVQDEEENAAWIHIITRKDSNPPRTICLNFNDTKETRMYHYGVVNTLELAFSDGFAEITAGILSQAPSAGSGTASVSEANLLAFKDARIYIETDFTTAHAAYVADHTTRTGGTKLSAFTLTINNNAEAQYMSGSSSPAQISLGQFEVGGNYTLFFEETDDRSAHELQTPRAMVVSLLSSETISGAASAKEEIYIAIPQFHLTDRSVDTAPAGFVTENPTFVGDYNDGGSVIVKIHNGHDIYEYVESSSSSSSFSSSSSSFSSSSSSTSA